MTLAIHLVVKNNEATIKSTLDSIIHLNSKIMIADLGCQDKTIELCKKYNPDIHSLSLNNDLSQVKNKLIELTKEKWILTIEPWECLIQGSEIILETIKKNTGSFKISIIQNKIITKDIRLWESKLKLRYENPVYETILEEKALDLPIYFSSKGSRNVKFCEDLINEWSKNSPLSLEPIYYKACNLLFQKKWKEFLNIANHYIFQQKKSKMSLTMLKYHCAIVQCYIMKNYQEAIKFIITCIVEKPTMAEFWCLLGDIFYSTKQFQKAISFYENAMILGSKRLKEDDYPFEIPKYKEYPNKMIENCKETMKNLKYYV